MVELDAWNVKEAIEFFKDKIVLTPSQFYSLARQAKVNAFTVSEITSLDILQDIFDELTKALESGSTMAEFRQNINARMEAKGWAGLTTYRADLVFRQNVQTAYQVGRWQRMTDPDVINDRPYGVYSAVLDNHTRLAHRGMHGVCRRLDDPFWDIWWPPNGFKCRCTVRTLSQRQVDRRGVKVDTGEAKELIKTPDGRVVPLRPDPGFDYNPGKEAYQPDLSKYSKRLRAAYEQRQSEKENSKRS